MNQTLTALDGVRVGHASRRDDLTGVTVVVFDRDLPIATCCYGGTPGTFNTDAFDASRGGERGHAIFVAGGSYTGLQSASEITRELVSQNIGYKTFAIVNPAVTGAIVMDLGVRMADFNPELAAQAMQHATHEPSPAGNVGAGTGASVGKFYYPERGQIFAGMKAGIGNARVDLENGAFVVALTVVNALGNVVQKDGAVLAGNRSDREGVTIESFLDVPEHFSGGSNTTISIVGTNVALKHPSDYERVAHLASQGQVRAINPVNLGPDGDTVFVFSTEAISDLVPPDAGEQIRGSSWPSLAVDLVGQAAALAVQESIYDGCRRAESITIDRFRDGTTALNGVVPSWRDI